MKPVALVASNKVPAVSEPTKVELFYGGYYYDVTTWVKSHPGGAVISFLTRILYTSPGEYRTVAGRQFHLRTLERVTTIMKILPRRPAVLEEGEDNLDLKTVERHRILTEDFARLQEEVKAEGWLESDSVRSALSFPQAFGIFSVGIVMSYFGSMSTFLRIFSVLLMSLAGGQALRLRNEGHNDLTGDVNLDGVIQSILYGFMFGLSASIRSSTFSEHRTILQDASQEVDFNALPILEFNKMHLEKEASVDKSFWWRHSKCFFVLCDTLIVTLIWKFNHFKYCVEHGKTLDLVCMGLHYSLVPVIGFVDWMAITWLGSIYVLGNLILSHTHLPVVEEGKQLHWVEYAFHHTTNIRSSWWVDWWTGHLNYQIEHHLFPSMPEYKNKLCREKTRAFAEKHNLPYYLCSYWEALQNTYHNLENVSEEIRHIM